MTKRELEGLLSRGSSSFKRENQALGKVPHSKPERHQKAALDGAVQREMESHRRTKIRFTGYRVRPLDPDNFSGSIKDLLDGLRHAGLISGDEPWKIILETEQVKVSSSSEERTEIEITYG